MSQDARNSIYLWVGGISFAVMIWLIVELDLATYFPAWLLEYFVWFKVAGIIVFGFGLVRGWFVRRHNILVLGDDRG